MHDKAATESSQLHQLNFHSCLCAGPYVEMDGTRRAPDFFVAYMVYAVCFFLLIPAAGIGYLIWQGQAELGLNTLGTY